MLEYFIPLVVLLGVFIGVFLAKVSPEEMKSGKKYFIFLKVLFFFIISITLFYLGYTHDYLFYIMFLFGVIFGTFVHWTYFYLGLALAASYFTPYLTLVGGMSFVFGIPFGTLRVINKKFNLRKILYMVGYFLLPFIMVLYGDLEAGLIFAFASGALFVRPIAVLRWL